MGMFRNECMIINDNTSSETLGEIAVQFLSLASLHICMVPKILSY